MNDTRRASDANKQLLRRFFDEVINGRNLDLIDELLADDFVEFEEFPGIPPAAAIVVRTGGSGPNLPRNTSFIAL